MDTDATTTVSKAGPEDLVATVWYRLGFKPVESLVLAGVGSPRQRIGLVLRADLPPPSTSRARLRTLVEECTGLVLDSGASGVVAMVMSTGALSSPVPQIFPVIGRVVAASGLELVDLLGVTPTAFRSVLCTDPGCCPPEGRPIETATSSRAAAIHVLNGDSMVSTQDDLVADVGPEPGRAGVSFYRPSGSRSYDRLGRGRQAGLGLAPSERRHRWVEWVRAFEAATAGVPDPAEPVLGLSGALHDPVLRDVVLTHLLGATDAQLELMLKDSGDNDGQADLAVLLRRRPDDERLAKGQAVLALAARVAAVGDRAPALAVLALLAWYQGRTGRARLLVERAGADSQVSLTRLVDDLLATRLPPPWAGIGPE